LLKVQIICSSASYSEVIQLLNKHSITEDRKSLLALVEKGCEIPDSCISIVFDGNTLGLLDSILDSLANKQERQLNIITGKKGDRYELIPFDRILYFEALGNDVSCSTDNAKYTVKERLYELEIQLNEKGFIRVSKFCIVNIIHVKEVIPWFNSRLLLKLTNDIDIEVTRKYNNMFKKFIGF
jgi:two-component system LytT family response regulator